MSSPIGYSAVFGRASDGKFHDIGASLPVAATGTLTSDTNNVSDGDTVTLTGPEGTWTYVFRTTITGTTTERQVLIGSTDDLSFANLIAEANQGRNKNPYGTFAAFAANASVFTANANYIGLIGNSIATTKSGSTLSWGAATLTGGTNASLKVDANVTTTAESTAEATAAAPAYTEGQDAPMSQNLTGQLRVIPYLPITQVVSTALEPSKVIKASAGSLVNLTAFSNAAGYILVMNSTTVPADGAVTLLYPPVPIAANQTIALDFPAPLVASTGIAVCISSTGSFTKTVGGSTCAFYAQIY